MKLSSAAAFLALTASSAFLMGKAAAGVEEHFGVGFTTKHMSNPPSEDVVINQILPNIKDKFGISNFRLYNADIDKEYVADLISGNKDIKFIVDIGIIWWDDNDQIYLGHLTQDDVDRYITRFIDTVGKAVKAKNGEDYEWLDNVSTIAYINEPYVHYGQDQWYLFWPTQTDALHGLSKINRMTQNFFNTYMDGKYKTKITIAPVFIGDVSEAWTEILVEESIRLQAEAGAPIAVYSNIYSCHGGNPLYFLDFDSLASCVGLPGKVTSSLESQVTEWKNYFEHLDIPVDPSEVNLVISETGWPTDGFWFGSEFYAGNHYNSILRLMNDPSSVLHGMDVYFFEALNEDLKTSLPVEPHWGLMYGDGTIKELLYHYWPWPFDETNATDAVTGSVGSVRKELVNGEIVPSNGGGE